MKPLLLFFVFFVHHFTTAQQIDFDFLDKISISMQGISPKINIIENNGFSLVDTNPADENLMADMIFVSNQDRNKVLIYYINDDCFSKGWCNTVDVYVDEVTANKISDEITSKQDHKYKGTEVTSMGLRSTYMLGDENIVPNTRIEITRYLKNNKNKYLISFQRSPKGNKSLFGKLRRRYKQYE
ncbi:MAG: hypothetical protein NXH73_06370 [Flavobacteriaceae bacterium]|nr:hypothetical protein [Flavobacteriaceae bacterium]